MLSDDDRGVSCARGVEAAFLLLLRQEAARQHATAVTHDPASSDFGVTYNIYQPGSQMVIGERGQRVMGIVVAEEIRAVLGGPNM